MNALLDPSPYVWLDIAVVAIMALSALLGLVRGLTREVLSLAVWLCALLVGWAFHKEVAVLLETEIDHPAIRLGAAFAILVLAVLLVGGIFRYLLYLLVKKTGLTGTDRVLGSLFGFARGAVLIAMFGFLGALTPLPGEDWWRGSLLIGRFQVVAERMLERMPAQVTDAIKRL